MARLARAYLTLDGTVPRSNLAEMLESINQICSRLELRVAYVFHAGDGNLHPFLLIDDPDNQDLMKRIEEIKEPQKKVWPSTEEIAAMDEDKKMKEKNRAEKRKNTLQNAIDTLKKKLADQEAELEKVEKVIVAVEQNSGQAKEKPEEKKC